MANPAKVTVPADKVARVLKKKRAPWGSKNQVKKVDFHTHLAKLIVAVAKEI